VLDWLTPEFRPFGGVIILAVLFVAVTSLINKYRWWQADKLTRVQRLMAGAERLQKALQDLETMVLPPELGDFCRNELLARYRTVQTLMPSYEGVGQLIAETESKHPGRGGSWDPPRLEDERAVNRHTAALTSLVDFLASEPLRGGMQPAANRALRERVRVLRAETRFAYYERATLEAARAGNWVKAQNDVLRLMGFLRQKAPPNEHGKELFNRASDLYRHYNHRQIPNGLAATDQGESRVA
jgi:hypothetical protein